MEDLDENRRAWPSLACLDDDDALRLLAEPMAPANRHLLARTARFDEMEIDEDGGVTAVWSRISSSSRPSPRNTAGAAR